MLINLVCAVEEMQQNVRVIRDVRHQRRSDSTVRYSAGISTRWCLLLLSLFFFAAVCHQKHIIVPVSLNGAFKDATAYTRFAAFLAFSKCIAHAEMICS